MTAEEYIDQINKIDALIISRNEEYERLVTLADGLGNFSEAERVQSSRDLHRAQNTIAKYIDLEREIDRLKEKRTAILATIERLPSIEYKIIYKYYLKEIPLKVIACDYRKSYDWAKKTKKRALRHLQSMIDEQTPQT